MYSYHSPHPRGAFSSSGDAPKLAPEATCLGLAQHQATTHLAACMYRVVSSAHRSTGSRTSSLHTFSSTQRQRNVNAQSPKSGRRRSRLTETIQVSFYSNWCTRAAPGGSRSAFGALRCSLSLLTMLLTGPLLPRRPREHIDVSNHHCTLCREAFLLSHTH